MARQFLSTDSSVWNDRFGNGSDGAGTISGATPFSAAYATCTGTSGSTSLTLGSASGFANTNIVIIHQSRAADAGKWELNRISSGAGTTSLTMAYPLQNTYTTGAQIVSLKQYSSLSVESGATWSCPSWNGSTGGVMGFLCLGDATITGTMSANSAGYLGASSVGPGDVDGKRGEGYNANRDSTSTAANTSGGGGGTSGALHGGFGGGSGGGGGHANAGSNGSGAGSAASGGVGGTVGVDSTTLTTAHFGGGGGGGGHQYGEGIAGSGGIGGGFVLIISKILTVTGSLVANGGNGGNATAGDAGGGGGGAGGAILVKGQNIILGSSKATATQGSGGTFTGSGANGASGSVGRIAVDYSQSVSGTANPGATTTVDSIFNDMTPDSYGFFM